jgi:hypothetical protein
MQRWVDFGFQRTSAHPNPDDQPSPADAHANYDGDAR